MKHATEVLKKIATGLFKLYKTAAYGIGSLVLIIIFLGILAMRGAGSSLRLTEPTQKIVKEGSSDKVAVVYLSGVIVDAADESAVLTGGQSIVAKKVIELLDYLERTDEVKAVVLRINSPGGAVVASDEIYRKVLALREKKPVVSSFGDTSASGGYYIAAGTNKIVVNPGTVTGSIGVIAQFPNLEGLYGKLGVEMRVFKSGQYKDIGSASREIGSEEEKILNTMINDAYGQFVSAIVEGRHMPEDKVLQLADGRIYTGKQAVENGLADELGDVETATQIVQNLAGIKDATIVEYSHEGFFETLFQSVVQVSPLTALTRVAPSTKFGLYYLWDM